jgi:hypothetical protein
MSARSVVPYRLEHPIGYDLYVFFIGGRGRAIFLSLMAFYRFFRAIPSSIASGLALIG